MTLSVDGHGLPTGCTGWFLGAVHWGAVQHGAVAYPGGGGYDGGSTPGLLQRTLHLEVLADSVSTLSARASAVSMILTPYRSHSIVAADRPGASWRMSLAGPIEWEPGRWASRDYQLLAAVPMVAASPYREAANPRKWTAGADHVAVAATPGSAPVPPILRAWGQWVAGDDIVITGPQYYCKISKVHSSLTAAEYLEMDYTTQQYVIRGKPHQPHLATNMSSLHVPPGVGTGQWQVKPARGQITKIEVAEQTRYL